TARYDRRSRAPWPTLSCVTEPRWERRRGVLVAGAERPRAGAPRLAGRRAGGRPATPRRRPWDDRRVRAVVSEADADDELPVAPISAMGDQRAVNCPFVSLLTRPCCVWQSAVSHPDTATRAQRASILLS